ncbi:MAG: alpha-2-macroglobulin family protein, partial [Pyrinomonadaceae bacterium]
LPAGTYELTFNAQSFKCAVVQSVPVQLENVTEVNVSLEVGGTTEVVTVTSEAAVTETASASMSSNISERQITELPLNGRKFESLVKLKPGTAKGAYKNAESEQQIETPRLREYFPETLVWQPELITDANGKATLSFKLADSLTTWKMAVIGSTVDGEVGVAEKEFKTFQPFFAEHDPPKILTEGDRIALPIVLRNYLDKPQKVSATMKEESWFKLSSSESQTFEVAPNSAQNAIFNFEAVAAVKDGKQRVTAIGTDSSDAIEKPVSVHPNGREMSVTQGKVFRETAAFDVNFPADALPGTQKAELKIYPNLMSHVIESVEGILHRPYGCGEQTISSTYPGLLILKASKNGADSALKARAQRYLQLGYDRLLGYKAVSGGFNYWGRGEADLALSAYALRFLLDAKEFIAVDEDLINETRDFLVKEQTADGSWRNSVIITAYTARILARNVNDEKSKLALQKALKFLQTESAKINEPYILAQYALALFDAGERDAALAIAEKLKTLAKTEGDGVYWNLETNTPFYGWGIAGRTETTALVLQVLAKAEDVSHRDAKAQSDNQISKGLQFLLKNKDRYGVWYSTQTTINVLDAMIELLPNSDAAEQETSAEIFVNGQKAQEISLPNKLNNPTTLDLTGFLTQTNNRVEVRQNGANNTTSAQIVENYYQPWKQENGFRANDSDGLRLKVDYDKTTTVVGDEITCRVAAERAGFKGYGMLLAEIGLPPGADVSRESLEKAVADSGWNLSSYDVLPDRVIVYLWAKAGGNKFEFKFKPRYGIEANTAPSMAYDYYNPDSNAVLAPTKFLVK